MGGQQKGWLRSSFLAANGIDSEGLDGALNQNGEGLRPVPVLGRRLKTQPVCFLPLARGARVRNNRHQPGESP